MRTGRKRSTLKEKDVGTDTDDLIGSEKERRYTSTGTQCNLGDVRIAPERVSTSEQSVGDTGPTLGDSSVEIRQRVGLKSESDVRDESERVVIPLDTEETFSVPEDFDFFSDAETVRTSLEDDTKQSDVIPFESFAADVPQEKTYYLMEAVKQDDERGFQEITAEKTDTDRKLQGKFTSHAGEEMVQEEFAETAVVVEEVESVPDMLVPELEMSEPSMKSSITTIKEEGKEKPVPHPTSPSAGDSVKKKQRLGDIVEGEEAAYSSSVTVSSRKRLVKQKTFPLTLKEETTDESTRVSVTSKEAEDVGRSTVAEIPVQKHGFSYEARRRESIEKLKSSMDDINISLGRRKSKARDLLLTKTGVDYHSFLIWIMFSEGELNNVKRVSATYSILMEQKAYLEVFGVTQQYYKSTGFALGQGLATFCLRTSIQPAIRIFVARM